MEKTIYDLELHEEVNLGGNRYATRVPGGWIYRLDESEDVFVPFSNEFKDWEAAEPFDPKIH